MAAASSTVFTPQRSPIVAQDIAIVSGARTPMAEWVGGKRGDGLPGGALAPVSAIELGAIAARAALERGGVPPERIDHVVMGNAMQTSSDAIYGARHVALKAGIPRSVPVDKDGHLFPSTTVEGLAKLPPAFGPESFVTAGNASGIVDGAAALVVTTVAQAQAAGRRPLGVVRGYASVGVDPDEMGIGPAPAIRRAAERAGLGVEEIELFEINEAFAGQYLAVEKELGLDRER